MEKETPLQVLASEFCEIFKGSLFTEHLKAVSAKNGAIFGNKI